MNIAAYCRVSTDKEDQLNSLEAQKEFFSEYTSRTGDVLVRLYADEGISGTKIKNRKELQPSTTCLTWWWSRTLAVSPGTPSTCSKASAS